jgi:nitric oxide reductase subunit B
MNLFPAGVLQLFDVLNNGYWHARGPDYLNQNFVLFMEWLRMPADLIFIIFGVLPLFMATAMTYKAVLEMRHH